MKELDKSTISLLQEKVNLFTKELGSFVHPAQAWDMLTQKLNDFKSSDVENKFVTIAAVMNLVSAIIQISFGMILKSMSVISSAIDSLLDFFLGFFNVFLLTKSKKKRDGLYNYGYGKLQGFGALSQGAVMLFFGTILAYFSILKFIHGSVVTGLGILIIIMILDLVGGIGCVAYYRIVIKKSTNMIVIGTLKKLYAGLLFNIGIMGGLVFIRVGMKYFDAEWYFIDALVGLIVAGYICFSAGALLYAGYSMLMDKSLSVEEIKELKELINSYQGDFYRRDELRTRFSGTTKFIEFTVYFDTKKTSFSQIYTICLFLKKHLEDDIENSVVTIVPKPLHT